METMLFLIVQRKIAKKNYVKESSIDIKYYAIKNLIHVNNIQSINFLKIIFYFVSSFSDYFAFYQRYSWQNKYLFLKKNGKFTFICKDKNHVNSCKNIFFLPYSSFTDFFKNKIKNENKIINCSSTKICKKGKKLKFFSFANQLPSFDIRKKWSNQFPIQMKLHRNHFYLPLLYKFDSKEVLLAYLQKRCRKLSMFYAVENPPKSFPTYWQISFIFEKANVKFCSFNPKLKVKCRRKWVFASPNEFSPIKILCQKRRPNSTGTYIISSGFFYFLFFYLTNYIKQKRKKIKNSGNTT